MTIQQALRLALQHQQSGQLEQAESICRQILAVRRDDPQTLNVYAIIAFQSNRIDLAEKLIRGAIRGNPGSAGFHTNLGRILAGSRRLDEAIAAYQSAIELDPLAADAMNNLGNALRARGQLEPAMNAYRQAVQAAPGHVEAHSNLAAALEAAGHYSAATQAYRRIVELLPDSADAHVQLAMALLADGELSEGWEHYEWRLRSASAAIFKQTFPRPRINSIDDVRGKRVLLYGEQGLGDTIMFCRYATLIAQQGAEVILGVRPELKRLMSSLPGVRQVIASGDPLPKFDLHSPLMSLPHVLNTTLWTILCPVPYLSADPQLVRQWESRLASLPAGMRIGICWRGSQMQEGLHRSPPPAVVQRWVKQCNATLVSLQKDPDARIEGVVDWSHELHDFADTAALVANVDRVISIDTAVAHLAGAMGKPTALLLPDIADWRWLRDREDSPWYPTVRLLRMGSPGDWEPLVRAALGG
jgi:Flp pilus assembly protein TadD